MTGKAPRGSGLTTEEATDLIPVKLLGEDKKKGASKPLITPGQRTGFGGRMQ